MTNKKKNIALLLGDPSGIGPELISKLLTQNELSNANITIIGEKNPIRLVSTMMKVMHRT